MKENTKIIGGGEVWILNDECDGEFHKEAVCLKCDSDFTGENWDWWTYCPVCGRFIEDTIK